LTHNKMIHPFNKLQKPSKPTKSVVDLWISHAAALLGLEELTTVLRDGRQDRDPPKNKVY